MDYSAFCGCDQMLDIHNLKEKSLTAMEISIHGFLALRQKHHGRKA